LSRHGYRPQRVDPAVTYNVQSVVFVVPSGVDRDLLIRHLRQRGIESTLGTYCLSATSYYRRKYDDVQPNALFLQDNSVTLPCSERVDVQAVCAAIGDYGERRPSGSAQAEA
jgi:dTDP-4-amino-4,6-dideoxygalactose transaminase